MIGKLKSLWTLFQKGQVVADPAKWKARQITSSMVVALLWAAVHTAEAFGLDLQVGSETVDAVAVGLLALVNWVLTLATSDKVGVSPRPKPDS
jgi:hypothetical protein